MAPRRFEKVPGSETKWKQVVNDAHLWEKTLQVFNNFQSASKLTQDQFLLFRTIVLKRGTSFDPAKFNIQQEHQQARALLNASTNFQSYKADIRNRTFVGQGEFGLLRKQQREVLEYDSSDEDKLTRIDETPVNATFINLLQAISEIPATPTSHWRHSKMEFVADFRHGRKYTAITDGQLQDNQNHAIKAIIECKKDVRKENIVATDMQEAAEIVAWIKCYPKPEHQRILVSQDNTEIYVTFATYDDRWLRHLRCGVRKFDGLMHMYQHSPWDLEDEQDVDDVAAILLAIALMPTPP
ncbi:hypothetical protein BGW36DRAFT_353421 [Talaromyces proteolyticus]|uniref:Uncharacterized protein n=1 Tax=Talaromyces proteolyticus TaxID=1131652 RepID=A0AAD4L1P3_9EURO|nr:uncharacterized protein BGW36DRAFT_353421 [Talaromyces proteolyticus]KAH8704991.1 hypothetical protein BGW36DRAFT_353421 [Talaromyces proteolyticus]